ncbi:MAG: carbon-nitrogen family hydrolase [Thermoanaerobacteraceae bacterium]|nr:carbon-nitrogen family hydrolase [Thermoanaerobacteraceae bacterium]
MEVSIIQMDIVPDIVPGEPQKNYTHALELMGEAMKDHPDVMILPEMFNTAYAFNFIDRVGDREARTLKELFVPFIKDTSVNVIAGSISNFTNDGLYNTAIVFSRDGRVVCEYDKVHLFGLMDEDKYLMGGQSLGLFEVDGVPCGVIICYDLRFPELTRLLALKGAKALFIPAEWPQPRLEHWRILQRARAIENQLYVISCNRVGKKGDDVFFGHSMVTDPWGEILCELSDKEEIKTIEIDLKSVDEVRNKIPVFKDRRADVYTLWTKT